jgi:hypothetical protein
MPNEDTLNTFVSNTSNCCKPREVQMMESGACYRIAPTILFPGQLPETWRKQIIRA